MEPISAPGEATTRAFTLYHRRIKPIFGGRNTDLVRCCYAGATVHPGRMRPASHLVWAMGRLGHQGENYGIGEQEMLWLHG